MLADSLQRFFDRELWPRLDALWLLLFDKPLSIPNSEELELVRRLKEACREIPFLDPAGLITSEAAWIAYANTVRDLILIDDPREFLRWKVVMTTMFSTNNEYVYHELRYLKSLPDWKSRWREALHETPVGHPIPSALLPSSSGNLIHQAYHLARFEEKSGILLNELKWVFEFGGGYGGMCRLCHNLGFRGKYLIYDLPVFCALQEFYLKATGLTVHTAEAFAQEKCGIISVSDQERLRGLLSEVGNASGSVFVAIESISEVPIQSRQAYLSLIADFDAFLICYSHRFREADNVEFFRRWTEEFSKELVWRSWQVDHMKNMSYLVGTRVRPSV